MNETTTADPVPQWRPLFKPSPLVLKQHGPNKAVVVRIHPDALLGNSKERMYEAWLDGRKIYDPADEYAAGQVIRLRK